jgi:plasmid stabilization system protein ParE
MATRRGSKAAYTPKQRRKARHIEDSVRARGGSEAAAKRIGWATVNKESGGGNRSGSGRGRPGTTVSSRKGGRLSHRARKRATG